MFVQLFFLTSTLAGPVTRCPQSLSPVPNGVLFESCLASVKAGASILAYTRSVNNWLDECASFDAQTAYYCKGRIAQLNPHVSQCLELQLNPRKDCIASVLSENFARRSLHGMEVTRRKSIDPSYIAVPYLETCSSYEAVSMSCPQWVASGAVRATLIPSAGLAQSLNWTACTAQGIWTDFFRCPNFATTYAQAYEIVVTALTNYPFPMYNYKDASGDLIVVCISGDGTCPKSGHTEDLKHAQYLPMIPAAITVDRKQRTNQTRLVVIE